MTINNGRLIAAAILVAGGVIASGSEELGFIVFVTGGILLLIEYIPWRGSRD